MYSFERRLRAFSIDIALAFILFMAWIVIAYSISWDNQIKMSIGLGIIVLTTIVPQLFSPGQSFGKRVQKMRIIYINNDEIPSLWILSSRELIKWLLIFISFGFYSIIAGIISTNRRDGRTIHDFIFKTKTICLTKSLTDQYINTTTGAAKDQLKGMGPHD